MDRLDSAGLLIIVIMRLRAVAVAAGGDQTSRHGRRDAEVPMQTVSNLNEAFQRQFQTRQHPDT